MSFWTGESLRTSCAGVWVTRPGPAPASGAVTPPDPPPIAGLSIDSRAVTPGQAFLALRGEKHDGHDHLAGAVEAGAAILIVDRPELVPPGGFLSPGRGRRVGGPVPAIGVADTRKALGRLAGAYRKTLENTRVIAVLGSNGKTTTCRLITAVLSTSLRGTASAKSYNNDVGVPLTILAASPKDDYLICEVGTNAPGEIAHLASIVQPDIAVVTSIGREHLEGLGSLRGVAREEASALAHLKPGGMAVVTADSPELSEHLKRVGSKITFGSAPEADLRITSIEQVAKAGFTGIRFTVNGRASYALPLLGAHNASNALAAIAVGRRLGIGDEAAADALAAVQGVEMRLERHTVRLPGGGGCEAGAEAESVEIINDAYNANPESTTAALGTLVEVGAKARRRVAVLGDMLELGEAGPDAHREVAQAVLDLRTIDLVVLVGPLSLYTAERLARDWPGERYLLVNDLADPGASGGTRADDVAAIFRPGDAVLLKGSRRMRLERVLAAAQRRADSALPGAGTGAGGGAPAPSVVGVPSSLFTGPAAAISRP